MTFLKSKYYNSFVILFYLYKAEFKSYETEDLRINFGTYVIILLKTGISTTEPDTVVKMENTFKQKSIKRFFDTQLKN